MIAKPVIKNKFWIVEDSLGEKIATIQTVTGNGSNNVVLVSDGQRRRYPSIKILKNKHQITFVSDNKKKPKRKKEISDMSIHGYPTDEKPFNDVFDVQRGVPVYAKSKSSKSFFCAGYYLINYNGNWVKDFCPKMLTLDRNKYKGPFKTEEKMKEILMELKG